MKTVHLAAYYLSLGLKSPALILLLGFAPLFVAWWFFRRQRGSHRAQTNEAFSEFSLRPAGESLRLRIEFLASRIEFHFLYLIASSSGVVALILLTPRHHQLWVGVACTAYLIFAYARSFPQLMAANRSIADLRLNYAGERMVGEELNQLRSEGYFLFQDVPIEGVNIDHILVGATGIYAVTTKARRKPVSLQDASRAKVIFDGKSLYFPIGTEGRWVAHAHRNAANLSKWLSKALSDSVNATPILTLPGWSVERRGEGDVSVLNPTEIKSFLDSTATQALTPERVARIRHELTERCRWKKESAETRSPSGIAKG